MSSVIASELLGARRPPDLAPDAEGLPAKLPRLSGDAGSVAEAAAGASASQCEDPEALFYAYMAKREAVRVRRDVQRLPREQWTSDPVLRRVRFTNVRREDDRTTRELRDLCGQVAEYRWRRLAEQQAVSRATGWTEQQRQFLGLLVFNYALWRYFGTTSLARAVGFLSIEEWTPETESHVAGAAMRCWRNGTPCFTDAYDPARRHRGEEDKLRYRSGGDRAVQQVYLKVCQEMRGVWRRRLDVVRKAEETRRWEDTTKALMAVSGYGGTGFLAKEVVQDLLRTPLFGAWGPESETSRRSCLDVDMWCAVGPGARRGLNRLRGRPVGERCQSAAFQNEFLRDLLGVFARRHDHRANGSRYWPEVIAGQPSFDLELHDVQFSLCEFDKYERARLNQPGRLRPFSPRLDLKPAAPLVPGELAAPGAGAAAAAGP